ncbi:cytochrome ubiquinol oxidase subunit I [Methylacidimicrobium tartarophylax]|uniref:Cytochrome c domain-containing protein n=1 Tax=Methylacidimicrobium tartarophylax TaxID=1041768 RepID=A0A5E6MGN5_9BACT|nr:cytochrome ubiquinol oxidase subunit I [Methylacidimicrobium tartarophylax]VVM08271.1 hypothetical protein MAMT_02249 [Methylacidimicrobium tartarophylax]
MESLGMYPTWYVPYIGSGWVMGITGTIHILASHTSIGASFLFALLETKAYRENKPWLLDYIRRYGVFLLVFSYIWGSVTGPGIWYSTTVASPRGISGLIHNFVWVWATEWVFFVTEVIGVYALVYTIGKIDAKTHLKLTWLFAIASLETLLLIIGILSFMMWPGGERWYRTGSVLDAFYNLNIFAQMSMRAAFMCVAAAVVGSIVVAGVREKERRTEIARFIAKMGFVGLAALVPLFFWYVQTLPPTAKIILAARLPAHTSEFLIGMLGVTALYLAWLAWKPSWLPSPVAALMTLLLLLFGLWPEERSRESLRKPYVAGQYIYGNQVISRDVPGKGIRAELPAIQEHGLLALHPFVPVALKEITPQNRLEAGRVIAAIACANCHSLEKTGLLRPLPAKFGGTTDPQVVRAFLDGPLYTGAIPYMPAIPLSEKEREALAYFIAHASEAPTSLSAVGAKSPNPR